VSKTKNIPIRLPDPVMDDLQEIASLAGLPVASVIKVILATEAWRWKNNRPAPLSTQAPDDR
jgi:predicted DNA binding CopG/RHH family protein